MPECIVYCLPSTPHSVGPKSFKTEFQWHVWCYWEGLITWDELKAWRKENPIKKGRKRAQG